MSLYEEIRDCESPVPSRVAPGSIQLRSYSEMQRECPSPYTLLLTALLLTHCRSLPRALPLTRSRSLLLLQTHVFSGAPGSIASQVRGCSGHRKCLQGVSSLGLSCIWATNTSPVTEIELVQLTDRCPVAQRGQSGFGQRSSPGP